MCHAQPRESRRVDRSASGGASAPVARAAVLVAAALLAGACTSSPVEWSGEPTSLAGVLAAASADSEHGAPASIIAPRLVLGEGGEPALVADTLPAVWPEDPAACIGSLRTARGSAGELYGVWWSRRSTTGAGDGEGEGRVALLSSRSDDGGRTWGAPVVVDTTDRGVAGCDRPPPAIAADARSDYVHVTYFLRGPEGPGLFFSHSMDRGELFHAPVPVIYGERPVASAVASYGDTVLVAFENPNTSRAEVVLAISPTSGHIFDRARPVASTASGAARDPLVAVGKGRLAVGWRDQAGDVVVRSGTLRE